MRTWIHRRSPALLALLALASALSAAEKPAVPPRLPDRMEQWVPSHELEKILEKNPNAVLLTPAQYEALIRDAGKIKPGADAEPPPVTAIVDGIQLSGRVLDGESAILLRGQIRARALASGWAETTVTLPWSALGRLSARGNALLEKPIQNTKAAGADPEALILRMRGPSEQVIEVECAAPILQGGSPDERVLMFKPSQVPAVLDLDLPPGSRITQGPAREMRGRTHRFFLRGAEGAGSTIAWRLPPPAGAQARVSSQSLRGVCRVSASEVAATYDVQVSSSATDSPTQEMVFDVAPATASVTAVEGEGVASWSQVGGALSVALSTESRAAILRVSMQVPVTLPEVTPLPVALPSLILLGARQVPALAEVLLEEGVELLEIQEARLSRAAVAEWDAAAESAKVLIRKVAPRIAVDADARVWVARDFVEIERTLSATSDVAVDRLKLVLPADEELLEVNWLAGPKLEWKRVEPAVEIDWLTAVQGQSAGKFSIKSRKKLDRASEQQVITVTPIAIPDAKKVAGYVALDHEAGWRIAIQEASGLEDRDARLTPVKGRMAWFSLRDHRLAFEVQRRESIVDAEITSYALPRARTIEMEGQISLEISGAPLRQIEVRVTPALARLLRFTSALIAEQVLDEATGTWKLSLARESAGRVLIRYRLSLPGRADGEATAAARTLVATFPRLEVPVARRFRGSWVVEANTDTQLSFATRALQPVDVMRVPAVQDYTPRHRLVAAFAYGTGEHELTVTAARHASSPLASLVVNQLRLTSVLSQDGSSRHEALLNLSHSGEQFAHVKLPGGAQLLSAIVDGGAVKPVRGEQGAIALPLPGGSANTGTVSARVLYELPGEPWQGTGKRKLEPVTLLGDAPILATEWTVHAPEGFSYDEVDTGLEQDGTFVPQGILGLGWGVITGKADLGFLIGGDLAHQSQFKKRVSVNSSSAVGPENPEAPPMLIDLSELRSNTNDVMDDSSVNQKEPMDPFATGTQPSGYLKDKTDRIIFPQVSFSNVTVEEAVEFLRVKSRDLDTQERIEEKKGVNFMVKLGNSLANKRISLDLKDVPLSQAIQYISELAGARYEFEPYAVVIKPLDDSQRYGEGKRNGPPKSEGSPKVFPGDGAVVGRNHDFGWAPPSHPYLADKMDRIIFPQVSFSGATLKECIDSIRDRSRELDVFEKLQELKGINLLLREGTSPDKSAITLDLRDVPMTEVLRYVVELAGYSFRIEGNAVVVEPISEAIRRVAGLKSAGFEDSDGSKSGIIPLELELPAAGQVLTFRGTQAPEVLELGYTSWEQQMARACLLMALGGLGFAVWGRKRAFLRTVLVVLLLALGVKLVAEARLPMANALLLGWLVAWMIWMVFRLLLRWEGMRASGVTTVVGIGLVFCWLGSHPAAWAEDLRLLPDPAAHTVIVPYDVKKPISGQIPQRYYLSRDSFEKLWSQAKENRRPEVTAGEDVKAMTTIHSAVYRATVEEERLLIEARWEIATRGAWTLTALPITSEDSTVAVVRDWMLDGKPAAVTNGSLPIEKPGVHQVQAVIELNRKSGWKTAVLKFPEAGAAYLELTTPMTDGRPELVGIDLLTEEEQGERRHFTAVMKTPSLWKLKRNPRRPLADATLPSLAESELIVGHSGSSEQSILGTVRFGFPGTERKSFSLTVDADWQITGWTVRQASGEVAVRHWSAREEAGRRLLGFEVDRPVADEATVSVWGRRSGGLGARQTPVLEPAALKGQQSVILMHDETLKLEPKPVGEQRRMDKPEGSSPVLAGGRGRTTELHYRLPPKQTLAYELRAADSGLECSTDYVFQLSTHKQEMMAAITLTRARDAWSQLRIGLPAEFEIQSVNGAGLLSWKQEKEDLFLQFRSDVTAKESRLVLYLARSVTEPQSGWKLQPLRFSDFEKQSGSALVVAHAATEAKLVQLAEEADLKETDPSSVAGVFFIAPPMEKKRALRFERGDWTADVTLARQEVRFSSDGIVLAQATDAGLLVSQQVAFFVEQGALGRVRVKLPSSLPEATVKGDALRDVQSRVNGAVREYECSFQSDVLAHAALSFDMELPLAETLTLPMVEVESAERLRRFFVLDNSSSREARVVKAEGVETCAKNALPYVPDVLSQPTFYRGKGAAGELQIAYQQLKSTEGNAAIVTLAEITTAWRADAERWDTVVYSVYNRSLQFLPVILPARAELVGVSVSGEAVRADEEKRADGSVVRLIPLIQTRAGQRSLEVKLIYRMKSEPGLRLEDLKSLRMDDPELLGISAERTIWTARVPKQFSVSEVDGNMEEVAEESKVIERLQGLMSDFSRMNKVLSSSNVLSRAEGDYTLKEAEKLARQIEEESSKVAQITRSRSDSARAKLNTDDGEKDKKMQGQVLNDITDLNESLVKQKVVLTENRTRGSALKKADRFLSNSWIDNQASDGKEGGNAGGFNNSGQPVSTLQVDASGKGQGVVLNDNTFVRDDFLLSPPELEKSESVGTLLGSGGVTVLNSVAGNITLNGGALDIAGRKIGSPMDTTSALANMDEGKVTMIAGTVISASSSGKLSEPSPMMFNGGNNGRANVLSQIQAQSAVSSSGVQAAKAQETTRDELQRLRAPAAPAPISQADPFSAPAAAPSAGGGFGDQDDGKARKNFDPPELPQSFGLEAQVSSQLRATGRRSLLVEVPAEGQAYHFRKLKDHALLELHLRKAWTDEQKSTALGLAVGLVVWALLSRFSRRRGRPAPSAAR